MSDVDFVQMRLFASTGQNQCNLKRHSEMQMKTWKSSTDQIETSYLAVQSPTPVFLADLFAAVTEPPKELTRSHGKTISEFSGFNSADSAYSN